MIFAFLSWIRQFRCHHTWRYLYQISNRDEWQDVIDTFDAYECMACGKHKYERIV